MIEFVTAECGIRQLYARFADAVWRKDAADFQTLWGPNPEWKIATMHFKGMDQINPLFGKLLDIYEMVQFITGPTLLELQGDGSTAIGRTNCTEISKLADGSGALTIGVYHDRFVRQDGRWLFQLKHFSLHYKGPLDLSGDVITESPHFGAFPGFPAQDQPTYTRRAQG